MKTSYLRKLKLYVWFPCYAGNGGYASLAAEVCRWWSRTRPIIAADPRIGEIVERYVGDTPVTMTRNAAVKEAKRLGCDLILMIDSDMHPDLYVGHVPDAKPFWQTAFEFVYERMERKLPTVAFAPYCGPPPHENVYVFLADEMNCDTYGAPSRIDVPNGLHVEQYTRAHAAMMTGIVPAYAGPTGAILFTTTALDCRQDADAAKPLFYYEYKCEVEQAEKASTEDVTFTRDISIGAHVRGLGPVVFCLWDCWWGHLKNKVVGKPFPVHPEIASLKLANMGRLEQQKKDAAQHLAIEEQYPGAFGTDEELEPPAVAPGEVPTPTQEPEAAPSPAVANTFNGMPFADERLNWPTCDALNQFIHDVIAKRPGEGYVVVAGDRDAIATHLACVAAVAHDRTQADFGIMYQFADFVSAKELDARVTNSQGVAQHRSLYSIASPCPRDNSPEEMDFDGQKIHAVIDLRQRVTKPIAPMAYAYFTLCDPTWTFEEGEGFRADGQAGNARTFKNVAYDEPEKEPRRERREAIGG